MDLMEYAPSISQKMPSDLLEIILLYLPFSVLMRFTVVSKQWNALIKSTSFLRQYNRLSIKDFGLIVPLFNGNENTFVAAYLNDKGLFSPLVVPFMERGYNVHSVVGSMLLLFSQTASTNTFNYCLMNPFTKCFKNIGSISVGTSGFFCLLQKNNHHKYGWLVLKHIFTIEEERFYICSSMDSVWRQTKVPSGHIPRPRECVFFDNKMWWLYLDTDFEDYPKYGYCIYCLDLESYVWSFTFLQITDIRCMSLGIYKNQLIAIINNGTNSVWKIEKVPSFCFGQRSNNWTLHYFEDIWGFKWTMLQDMSADINKKCRCYLPYRYVNGILLMCKSPPSPYLIYNLSNGSVIHTNVENICMLRGVGYDFPFVDNYNDLVESGTMFPLIPSFDSVDDVLPIPMDVLS